MRDCVCIYLLKLCLAYYKCCALANFKATVKNYFLYMCYSMCVLYYVLSHRGMYSTCACRD